jgi:hypothetical protein
MLDYSPFFTTGAHEGVAAAVHALLAHRHALVSPETVQSASGVGGAVQHVIEANLQALLGEECAGDYEAGFSARSMPDARFVDRHGFLHNVNIKAQDMGRQMSMPNLVSAQRLRRALRVCHGRREHYDLLWVRYRMAGTSVHAEAVYFFPIEWLPWDNLAIQAQGEGMLQMQDGKKLRLCPEQRRFEWSKRLFWNHAEYHEATSAKALERARRARAEAEIWERMGALETGAAAHVLAPDQLTLFGG